MSGVNRFKESDCFNSVVGLLERIRAHDVSRQRLRQRIQEEVQLSGTRVPGQLASGAPDPTWSRELPKFVVWEPNQDNTLHRCPGAGLPVFMGILLDALDKGTLDNPQVNQKSRQDLSEAASDPDFRCFCTYPDLRKSLDDFLLATEEPAESQAILEQWCQRVKRPLNAQSDGSRLKTDDAIELVVAKNPAFNNARSVEPPNLRSTRAVCKSCALVETFNTVERDVKTRSRLLDVWAHRLATKERKAAVDIGDVDDLEDLDASTRNLPDCKRVEEIRQGLKDFLESKKDTILKVFAKWFRCSKSVVPLQPEETTCRRNGRPEELGQGFALFQPRWLERGLNARLAIERGTGETSKNDSKDKCDPKTAEKDDTARIIAYIAIAIAGVSFILSIAYWAMQSSKGGTMMSERDLEEEAEEEEDVQDKATKELMSDLQEWRREYGEFDDS